MPERLIVVGADAAGMTAASLARRRDRSLEVIAFEKSGHASYAACGEPYYVSGDVAEFDDLIARTPEQFARAGIELNLHHEVTGIDLAKRVVTVHSDAGDTEAGFDRLLIATGATAVVPPIPGSDLDGVYTLRTLGDAEALRRIAAGGSGDAVIIGAGYIGLEVAEAFNTRGWTVTVVEALPSIMARTLDPDLAEGVATAMEAAGVRVLTAERAEAILGNGRVSSVVAAGETITADVVVLAVGSRPVAELAADAGIALGNTGAIAVDERQRTSADGVWSAGDCAEVKHRVTGKAVNLHLGTVANKTGRIAGMDITGGDATFPGVLGTAITKFHDLEVSVTGVSLGAATESGLEAVEATVSGQTAAHYMPQASGMTIKVVAERGSARLLGAQIVGGPGAGKRIDTFATGVWNGMAADDLAWVDLAYAPPFAPVWDLVAIAARKAASAARS